MNMFLPGFLEVVKAARPSGEKNIRLMIEIFDQAQTSKWLSHKLVREMERLSGIPRELLRPHMGTYYGMCECNPVVHCVSLLNV